MRRTLTAVALVAGILAPFAHRPAANAQRRTNGVSAAQLATWIRDRKPGLRVVDHRSRAAYEWYHIPGARHDGAASGEIVVIAGDAFVLQGGMQAWLDLLATPAGRYFGGPPRRGGC